MSDVRPLSDIITGFVNSTLPGEVSVNMLLEVFHERGLGAVLILFAAPMALPLPVPPGINIALATPLIFLTLQQALGAHKLWLPNTIKRKTFQTDKLTGLLKGLIPWLQKAEILLRPRLGWITQGAFSNLIGILGLIMALTVCIPVPLTNTVPSFGITLMALGVMMRDGLAVIAGALIGIGWVSMLAITITLFGPEAITMIKGWF